jgi:hypothetical protein
MNKMKKAIIINNINEIKKTENNNINNIQKKLFNKKNVAYNLCDNRGHHS